MSAIQIENFEVMFAIHTGVTIMTPKVKAFDSCEDQDSFFSIPTDSSTNLVVTTPDNTDITIKGIKEDYIAEAKERGFIMIYELNDEDEVVRCTPCQLKHV